MSKSEQQQPYLQGIGDYFGMKEITFVIENHKWDGPMKTVRKLRHWHMEVRREPAHGAAKKKQISWPNCVRPCL